MKKEQTAGGRKALFFFCVGEGYDHVSRQVFEKVLELYRPDETGISVDG